MLLYCNSPVMTEPISLTTKEKFHWEELKKMTIDEASSALSKQLRGYFQQLSTNFEGWNRQTPTRRIARCVPKLVDTLSSEP